MIQQIDLGAVESVREQVGGVSPQRLPQEIMRARALRLALRGLNATKAAAVCQVSPHTMRRVYADPSFQREVRMRFNAAFEDIDSTLVSDEVTLHERIRRKSTEAFEVLCNMLDDQNTHPGYRMRIAQDLLDRNEETQSGSVLSHKRFDPDQLRQAAVAAREMDKVVPIKKVG